MLKEADPSFPEVFFSLDGGIIRESSAAYQFAKEIARCKGWGGFTNLLGGIFGGDMFPSDDVKKIMEMYLLQESSRVPISLYVPETLGICDWIYPVRKSCPAIIDGYRKITQDESWIGLLIWQHKYKADHAKDLAFVKGEECMGCTESGMDREKKEGKKYSNAAYEGSMKKGRRYLEMAPGGRYEIHNAGRRGGISVMWDTSPPGVGEEFAKIMRRRRDFRYVRGTQASPVPPPPMNNAAGLKRANANTTQLQGEGANTARLQGEGANSLSGISTTPIGEPANASLYRGAITSAASSGASNGVEANARSKSNAKFATRKKAAEVARSDPSFLRKVAAAAALRNAQRNAQRNAEAALRSALRNAEEGTPEAAAKRLAALRMPTKAQQEEYATVAKRLTAERRAEEKAMAEKAKRNAAIQRKADAAAASYVGPEREASRAEKEKINRYSYSGNVGNLSNESMIGNVIDI
jgi:hypothetical protein